MHNGFQNIPYDLRNSKTAGNYHGVGMAGKVGSKKGGFPINSQKVAGKQNMEPPRKMG